MKMKYFWTAFCCLTLGAAGTKAENKTDAGWNIFAPLDGVKTRCAVPVKDNSFQLIRAKRKDVWIFPSRKDFTPYNALSFEIDANGKENSGGEMGILLYWKNPDPKLQSYYMHSIPVSFTGKKKIVILFREMSRNRNPQLNPIAHILFATSGWGLKVDEDFAATISNLRLLKLSPEEMKKLDPDKKPVVNFRKMVYPNLCGVTAEDVKKIAACLPDRPGLPGGNIHDRGFWSRYPIAAHLVTRAETRLKQNPPRYTREDLEQKKPWPLGGRQLYVRELERYIASMTPYECKENKGRFIPRISEAIESYLDNPVPVGHTNLFDPDYTRILRKGFRYVELNNAFQIADIAVSCWLLNDKLPEKLRKRVNAFADEWMFSPMFQNLYLTHASDRKRLNHKTWAMFWINFNNNWNPFCSFYVLVCAHALLESKEERAYLTASLIKSMDRYLASLTDTGYITEGVGYWEMGFSAYLRCARLLYDLTGGKLDLLANAPAKVRRSTYIARDMMMAPGGLYPHFADHGQEGKARPFWNKELDRMNQAFGENIYPVPENYTTVTGLFFCDDYFSVLLQMNRKKNLKKVPGQKLYFWDPQAQVLVARDEPNAEVPFSFAFKGGHNGELHNHNDVGSFVVGVGKKLHLGDPGVGVYNVARKISAIRSIFHPVPLPNGQEQRSGAAFAGKVLAVENDDLHSMVHLDIKSAYPAKADLKKLERKVVYDRKMKVITISDVCEFNKPGTYALPLPSFEDFKELSPGVWTAGSLRVEVKGIGGELEIRVEKPEVKLRTKKMFSMLVCKFKGKVQTCGMTVALTLDPRQK